MRCRAQVVDQVGAISAVPNVDQSAPKMPPMTAVVGAYLPYDESVVYEDLTEMRKIHLPSLLHNVEQRFLRTQKIYSYIGNMSGSCLLAVPCVACENRR
jgi:myosin heavy subunit